MGAKSKYLFLLALPAWVFIACTGCKNKTVTPTVTQDTTHVTHINIPEFNADSAYNYIKTQVDFGPRIPGTEAHEKCLQFFLKELAKDSLKVTVQRSSAKTFDGKTYQFQNVIASFQPENPNRIVLFGHWDTRPWADLDTIDPDKPFDGADDGGSSAAMLLEIARHLKKSPPNIGVDLVFIDLEDYGQQSDDDTYPHMKDSWCLGSQYWAHNLPQGYSPRYGILLDMVGGKNAIFPKEGTSMDFAPDIVNKIWGIASNIGYGSYFTQDKTDPTIDDHLYINRIANIPTIDIVDYKIEDHDYPYFHHKHSDSMDVIDKSTLGIVGKLLMTVIYAEKSAHFPQS